MSNPNIDRSNFYNDPRTVASMQSKYFDILEERNHIALVSLKEHVLEAAIEEGILPDDSDGMIRTTVKYATCTLCRGSGSVVNPAIDCSGLSIEDFTHDPEFAEAYSAGEYNIPCTACRGIRVTLKPDFDPSLLVLIGDIARDDRSSLQEQMAELAFGC